MIAALPAADLRRVLTPAKSLFFGVCWGLLLGGCGPGGMIPSGDGGLCEAKAESPVAPGQCVSNADCEGGVCSWSGSELRCTSDSVPVGAPCAAASECTGLCIAASTCRSPCAEDADCPGEQRCAGVRFRSDDGWGEGRACVPRSNATTPVVRRLGVGAEVPLGEVDEANLHVIESLCAEAPALLALEEGPRRLFDAGGAGALNPFFSFVPGTDSIWLPSGDFAAMGDPVRAVYGADSASWVHHTVQGRGGAVGTSAPGVLDLDLFFVGATGEAEAEVREAVAEADVILRSAGLRLGALRTHRIDGELGRRFEFLEMERGRLPELSALLRLSAGVAGPSVPVFLVREAGVFLGIGGGIPGPLGVPGTDGSGIVLALDTLDDGLLGRTLAHELGHHLGLFHLYEIDGTVRENLRDTPECTLANDRDGNGFLDELECAELGGGNLMFWGPRGGTELSEGQRALLRRAPVLQSED